MKISIKKILFLMSSFLLVGFTFAALNLEVPPSDGYEDVNVGSKTVIQSQESTLVKTISLVNNYLWFILGAIFMAILVYAGITLITADGDKTKMAKANKMIMGSLVGLGIVLLAAVGVRLLVNLF